MDEAPRREMLYAARDGNYGDATGLVVVDVTEWTEEDYDRLEEAPDHLRSHMAILISRSKGIHEKEL